MIDRFVDGRARELIGFLGALVLAVVSAIAITWPVVNYMDQVVLGSGELGGWLWRYDWHFQSLNGIVESDLGPLMLWREFVGLGRFPETGNIMDVLVLSYPLEQLFGFPTSYNLKILIILTLNGLSGYALARYFSGSVSASLAASVIAVINPITIYEIQSCGLRQAVLWWVCLYPPLLDRALRRRTWESGLLAGACFGIAAAFYWFYGLFTGVFTLIWLVKHLLMERSRLDISGTGRVLVGVGLGVVLCAGPFILPYVAPTGGDDAAVAQNNSASSLNEYLPEMTFFLPFPAYDTISNAPLRPSNYAENVLASIHRTLGSSWSVTYAVDPRLREALPLIVLIFGVLPAVTRQRSWGWLAVWLVFYAGTLGPFLKVGQGAEEDVVQLGDFVIRMPYAWMFQFVPGMSRMFAPYRLGAYVVVASVALVAIGLSRLSLRAYVAPVVMAAVIVQPMLRLDKGTLNPGQIESGVLRTPVSMSKIKIPDYYMGIDPKEEGGIIELPLDQQQDLLCIYQLHHRQKLYRSWASPSAIPPALREKGSGGEAGERLRFLAKQDVVQGPIPLALDALSRQPDTADLTSFTMAELQAWAKNGNYHTIIVHERGYYLVDSSRGPTAYTYAIRRIQEALGVPYEEFIELRKGDPANPEFGVPFSGDLAPWSSQPVSVGIGMYPDEYRMAVFQIPAAPEAAEGDAALDAGAVEAAPPEATPAPPADGPTHTPAPPGAPAPSGSPTPEQTPEQTAEPQKDMDKKETSGE